MQHPPRSNRDRSERTRSALIRHARSLFVDRGYAGTSTPEIVAAAGITRGALYHHFADKRALFHAVIRAEAEAVAADIERGATTTSSPLDALLAGSAAYLDAMREPGRTRLLLIEGPSVLGVAEMKALDEESAARTLRDGLCAAMAKPGKASRLPLDALTDLLSAAFDRAALAIEAGGNEEEYRAAITALVRHAIGR